jgi:hypothetical protein
MRRLRARWYVFGAQAVLLVQDVVDALHTLIHADAA